MAIAATERDAIAATELDAVFGHDNLDQYTEVVTPLSPFSISLSQTVEEEHQSIEKLIDPQSQPSDSDFYMDLPGQSYTYDTDQASTEAEDSGPGRKKVGRKTKEITRILKQFVRRKAPSGNVKKEYLRVLVIRGFKRAIREVLEQSVPRKKVHGFEQSDSQASNLWRNFRVFVRKHCSKPCTFFRETVKHLYHKTAESDVVAAMDDLCNLWKYKSYDFPPPQIAKGCDAIVNWYEEELEWALVHRYELQEDIETYFCYTKTGACKDVNMQAAGQSDDFVTVDGEKVPLQDGKVEL